jgi:hypothetical protein
MKLRISSNPGSFPGAALQTLAVSNILTLTKLLPALLAGFMHGI